MSQLQWRSDDTYKWGQGFGNGSDGAFAPGTGTDSVIKSTFTGTLAAFTGIAANAGGGFAIGQIVIIHQTQGTGAGSWQLNYIIGISGTTLTFLYPLTLGYVTGAQIQVIKQYTTASIAGGVTLTGVAWDGSTGGIMAIMCNGSATITGTAKVDGNTDSGSPGTRAVRQNVGGFRGGPVNSGGSQAGQGESNGGVGGNSTGSNGSGGGGAAAAGGGGADVGGSGGHATVGATSSYSGSGANGNGGGTSGDSADLTTMHFGGGAGGSNRDNGDTLSGQNGGGIVIVIAPNITVTGQVNVKGGDAVTSGFFNSAAGGGGSALFKGQKVVLGSGLVLGAGGNINGVNPAGGNGRIHVDYSVSVSGTATPTIDSRQDSSYANNPMGFIA